MSAPTPLPPQLADFSPDKTMSRVRRISRWMVWACWGLLVVMPAALVLYWAGASPEQLMVNANLAATPVAEPLRFWQRVVAAAVSALPMGLASIGIWQARRCFAQFAQGQVFTTEATSLLRRFAGWVAAAALGAIVASAVVSVVLTLNNPPGMRQLAVGISSTHVFTLFFAATVWLMAAVIGQGQALAEENQNFV
jgi:magnesium-transporting ATPase (P-type)